MPDHFLFSSALLNRLPVATLLLLVLMSSVFSVASYFDAKRMDEASTIYQSTGLLGAEAPRYLEYLERRIKVEQIGSPARLEQIQSQMVDGDTDEVSRTILADRQFYQHLVDEGHVFWLDSQYDEWFEARDRFVEPIIANMTPIRFGLIAGELTLSDLFTHFLLHTNLIALLLNIGFAIAFVFYLEERVGKARVFMIFIAGGALSGLVNSWFVVNGTVISGASGSIAALTGLYMAYAYDHGVEPKYEKLRVLTQHNLIWIAFVAFLLIVKEALELFFAYWEEHDLVGHVAALLLGLGSYLVFKETVHDIDEARSQQPLDELGDDFKKEFARAFENLSRLEFEEAKDRLIALKSRFPNSIETLLQLYRLEKLTPPSPLYWEYAGELIALVNPDRAKILAQEMLEDLRVLHKRDPEQMQNLDAEILNKLMMIFVNENLMNDAEQVYFFMQMSEQKDLLQEACLVLSQAFKSQGRKEKVQHYKNLLSEF